MLKVGLVERQSSLGNIKAYYALVEVQTAPAPENAIAVFEVDGNMEEAVLVGDAEGYFPEQAVELYLAQ